MFLVTDDYRSLIKSERLDEILDSDNSILAKALPAAQEEAAGYIRHRYDEAVTFKSITTVSGNAVTDVSIGDKFYQSTTKLFYTAIQAGGTDLTDTNYFTVGDTRNAKLVEVVIDIVLYNLHSRINPKAIPTHRRIRYDGDDPKQQGGALGWLKNVQKGVITPDLTVITDENGETPQNTEGLVYGNSSQDAYGF